MIGVYLELGRWCLGDWRQAIMVEVMHMMMFVVAMRFAGAQCDLVHLEHRDFHVQVVVDRSGLGRSARVQGAVWLDDVADNLMK